MKKLMTVLLLLPFSIHAQNINTVAGNDTAGYFGDGGPAIHASFFHPAALCFDKFGAYFVADEVDHVIRKVDLGIITTFAGTGVQGYSGDNVAATNAQFNYPNSVALDSGGNLYIADAGNNRIRKVDMVTHMISTVAGNGTPGYMGDGGQATAAELSRPTGLYVDQAGNIFIADTWNNVVRKVDGVTGIISTIAGNGLVGFSGDGGSAVHASLNSPIAVCEDGLGNIYIADARNARVRKVFADGQIETIAGDDSSGYSGDGGLAVNSILGMPLGVTTDKNNNVYIADNNNTVRKIDIASGIISTIAGTSHQGYSGDGGPATNARLYGPNGVTIDVNGNVFIADENNNVIRRIVFSTGVPDVLPEAQANIYPNPAQNELTITFGVMITNVAVYSILGQAFNNYDCNSRIVQVDVSHLPPGVYFVKINDSAVRKFIKE